MTRTYLTRFYALAIIVTVIALAASAPAPAQFGPAPSGSTTAAATSVDASGFSGNLAPTDDTVQKALAKLDTVAGGIAANAFKETSSITWGTTASELYATVKAGVVDAGKLAGNLAATYVPSKATIEALLGTDTSVRAADAVKLAGNTASTYTPSKATAEALLFGGKVTGTLFTYRYSADCLTGITTKKPMLFAILPTAATTFSDFSGYGNTVTAVGSPSAASPVGAGYGITPNGSTQYFTIPDRDEFSFGNGGTDVAFSVEAVAYLNTSATRAIVSKIDNTTSATVAEWALYTSTGNQVAFIVETSNGSGYLYKYTGANATGYHHVVFTYDGSKAHTGILCYIDGAAASLTNGSGGSYTGMSNTTTQLTIGAEKGASAMGSFFNDTILDVNVYASALTSSEVFVDYLRARSLWGI